MLNWRRFAASLALFGFAISPVVATDLTDLWWNASESGWGLNVAHQGDSLFLTFYVYSADSKPTWFTSLAKYAGSTASGALIYTGDLYATTGPYFGGPFDPNQVGRRNVGTATFRAESVTTATLTYTVDGVSTSKPVQRATIQSLPLTGNYLGAIVETDYNCTNPALNGKSTVAALLNVQQVNQQVTMAATITDGTRSVTCTYGGTFNQAGRMVGISDGTFSCSSGASGAFMAYEIEVSPKGITGRFDLAVSGLGCLGTGTLGGLRVQ